MAESIKDGRTGDTMAVDSNNRAHVQSLSLDVDIAEALNNNTYDVSTGGLVNLADGVTQNALLYIKNDGDSDLIVNTIFIDSDSSSGGSGVGTMSWVLNPTAGDIINDASVCQVLNRRIGSPVNVSATCYKATASGKTFDDGDSISFPLPDGVGIPFGKPFVIPKGQAFGVSYKAPTGNTSMDIQVGILIIVDTTQST